MGRVAYCQMIQRDVEIAGTLARTTTIPEDLGRIAYLLTDKTGTLTKNEMIFKKIHFGRLSYGNDLFEEVASILAAYYRQMAPSASAVAAAAASGTASSGGGAGGGAVGKTGVAANYQTHRRESSTASTASFTVERRHHMRVNSYDVDQDIVYRVQQSVLAIALCHNVTPATESPTFGADGKEEVVVGGGGASNGGGVHGKLLPLQRLPKWEVQKLN